MKRSDPPKNKSFRTEIILTVLVTVILFKIPQIHKILTSADSAEEK